MYMQDWNLSGPNMWFILQWTNLDCYRWHIQNKRVTVSWQTIPFFLRTRVYVLKILKTMNCNATSTVLLHNVHNKNMLVIYMSTFVNLFTHISMGLYIVKATQLTAVTCSVTTNRDNLWLSYIHIHVVSAVYLCICVCVYIFMYKWGEMFSVRARYAFCTYEPIVPFFYVLSF